MPFAKPGVPDFNKESHYKEYVENLHEESGREKERERKKGTERERMRERE